MRMNYKILYANGCSHTEGQELGNEQFNYFELTGEHRSTRRKLKKLGALEHLQWMEDHAWPKIFANELNIPTVQNAATSGSSNKKIVRNTIHDVTQLLKQYSADEILVAIGWSGFTRHEIIQDDEWCQVVYPSSKTRSAHITERHCRKYASVREDVMVYQLPVYMNEYFKDVFALKAFLKSVGVSYMFTSCVFERVKDTWDVDLIELTIGMDELRTMFEISVMGDFIEYVHPYFPKVDDPYRDLIQWGEFRGLSAFLLDKKYPVGVGFHPLEEGQEAWGKYLAEEILKRKI